MSGSIRKPLAWIRDGACIRCTSHSLNNNGYPQHHGKPKSLCRLIMFRRHGSFPTNIVARHLCDNRWCINPDHISPGTHAENAKDAILFGKLPFGEQKTQAKLKNKQVAVIRQMLSDGLTQKSIAKRFGVSASTISYISTRKAWSKV